MKKQPTPVLRSDATPEERAAYVATLSKRQRIALLRAMSGPLYTTSQERVEARDAARNWTKGV